jgi:nicotinate-nucleotide adenylyltransferase
LHLAIFGGTCDPPHNGHLALCLFARELLGLDRLIVSVSHNPLKQQTHTPDIHRRRMAELFVSELNAAGSFAEPSYWELEQEPPSFTIDLVRHVRSRFSSADITLLVGEDSYRDFPKWKSFRDIAGLCSIAVFMRPHGPDPEPFPEPCRGTFRFIAFDMPVSASGIRERIACGHQVGHMLPSAILHYIEEHRLYLS